MTDALFKLQVDRETRTGREQRLTAELARVRGLLQRQWISVEERLPEVSDMYIVAAKPAPTNQVSTKIDVFSAVWEDDVLPGESPKWLDVNEQWVVTHWMPQPLPPKVDGEGVEVGRGEQQTKSSTGNESPSAIPSGQATCPLLRQCESFKAHRDRTPPPNKEKL